MQETNAGSYCVVVSNELGRAVSAAAGLRVLSLLSWQTAGPDLTLTWTGPYVLQASTNVSGPYFDVPGTTSPFVASTLKPRQFFRLRALQAGRLSLGMVANNEFTLTAAGLAGYNYIVEASTNLAVWVPLQTNPAPFVFVDTETTNFGRRFYRTVFSR